MLPDWMEETDTYVPPADGGTFMIRTIKSLGKVMARLQTQKGKEQGRHLPSLFKLFLMLGLVLLVSLSRSRLLLLALTAGLLLYLCTWPPTDLWHVIRAGLTGAFLAFLLFLPAMLLNPQGAGNNRMVVGKVFLSVSFVSIYNHTTQWNHITGALRRLHIPGNFYLYAGYHP